MSGKRNGIAKVILIAVLAVIAGMAFVFMTREQEARSAAETTLATIKDHIDSGLTPEEIHEKVGREPDATRIPGQHRYVEEYHWSGPFSQHKVYTYYTTGATKLLEAVSMNQKLEDWEGDALKVRQD